MHRFVLTAVLCASGLTGCAIHPQTDDLSRDSLPEIVMKIRCEAKAAILQVFPDETDYLRSTSVGFKFEFTMKENDDLGSNGTVKIPISFGSFTMGWESGLQKERRSIQTIGVGDNFKRLADLPCPDMAPGRNILYPITGEVGILKTVENYARLVDGNRGLFVGEISDILRFQTDWNATLKPSWNLVPLSKQVIAINASVTGKRSDIHQVTISFLAPAKPLTVAEKQAKEAAETASAAKARKLELQRMAEEKAIPTHFVLVDPDNKPIDPRTLMGVKSRPGALEAPLTPEAQRELREREAASQSDNEKRLDAARNSAIDKAARARAAAPPAPAARTPARPAPETNDQRAYEQLQQNEALRTNQRILDELRARGAL